MSKKVIESYDSFNHGTKMTSPGNSLWNGFLAPFVLEAIETKINLKDKGQIPRPNEYTDNFKSNLTCIFLSLSPRLKNTFCPRTLYMTGLFT